MLLVGIAAAVLWQAGVMGDMSRCRVIRTGAIGPEVGWQTDGRGKLWFSSRSPDSGTVALHCKVRVPNKQQLRLEIDRVSVSFVGAQSDVSGSGLTIRASRSEWKLLRTAGEDWAQTEARRIEFTAGGPEVVLKIAAIDSSNQVPVRIDITGLRLIAAEP